MTQQKPVAPTFSLASFLPPYHEITLPTAGYYDPNIPECLHVRGLTVKELKNLTATGKLDRKIFDATLASCIQESIDLNSLLIQDYNYIVYMIRLYSTSSKVTSVKICDNQRCYKQFKFEYNISDIAKVTLADEPIERTKTVELPRFVAEHNLHVLIEVKRLTRKDIVTIENSLRMQTEIAAKEGSNRKIYPLIEYLKAYIVSVSGLPIDVPKDQLLEVLSSEDAEIISSAFDNTDFGVSGIAHPECPYCHELNDYDIPFTDAFFL